MGDYSNAQLTVYSCPPEEVRAFTRLIDEYGLKDDWCGDNPPANEIILGHTYCDNDVNIGFVNDYTVDAPNSAWVRWNDPKYEYLGDLEIHVPGLGYFRAQCNADGEAQFSTDQIIAAIEKQPADAGRDQILMAIGELTGKQWNEAIAALTTWEHPNEGPTVKAAPFCGWCEELIVKSATGTWIHKVTGKPECANQKVHVAEPEDEEDE